MKGQCSGANDCHYKSKGWMWEDHQFYQPSRGFCFARVQDAAR